MSRVKPVVTLRKTVRAEFSHTWIRSILASALEGAKHKGQVEIGVGLIGDAEMKRLNLRYRQKNMTTDVLSFDGDGDDLGDILISVPQAGRQAREDNRPLRSEVASLLVHGCLHIVGYDHMRTKDAKIMLPLQAKILKRLGYV